MSTRFKPAGPEELERRKAAADATTPKPATKKTAPKKKKG